MDMIAKIASRDVKYNIFLKNQSGIRSRHLSVLSESDSLPHTLAHTWLIQEHSTEHHTPQEYYYSNHQEVPNS